MWSEQGRTVTRGGPLDQVIHKKLELWGRLLSKIKAHMEQVVVWLPGIRRRGTVLWWNTWVGKMETISLDNGAKIRWFMKREEGGMEAYWRKLRHREGRQDWVHYPEAFIREILIESL